MKNFMLVMTCIIALSGCCKVTYQTLDKDPATSKAIARSMIKHYLDPNGGVSTDFKDRPQVIHLDRKSINALEKSAGAIRLIHAAYTKDHPSGIAGRKKNQLTVIVQIEKGRGLNKTYEYVDIYDLTFTGCKSGGKILNDPPTGICPPPRNCSLPDIDLDSN